MKNIYTKKIKRKDRELFELLPGYACNANCRFCSIDKDMRGFNSSTEKLLADILKAKKDGFKYLGIGGGEPTIRKDLVKLISFAKKINFDIVRIETNGIALAYFDYCKSLVDAGLDFVKISVHSHKKEIHDFLTQVPGSFKNILKAIDNLQRLGVRIEINTVITKYNYKQYSEFVDFFSQLGIGSFCFIYPTMSGQMIDNIDDVGVKMNEASAYLKSGIERVEELELDKGIVFNVPPCFLGEYKNRAVEGTPFNTMVETPGGTTESVDFDRIENKIKLESCIKCHFFDDCEGVWKNYIEFFGDQEFKNYK